jgi:hypothetical protein
MNLNELVRQRPLIQVFSLNSKLLTVSCDSPYHKSAESMILLINDAWSHQLAVSPIRQVDNVSSLITDKKCRQLSETDTEIFLKMNSVDHFLYHRQTESATPRIVDIGESISANVKPKSKRL